MDSNSGRVHDWEDAMGRGALSSVHNDLREPYRVDSNSKSVLKTI